MLTKTIKQKATVTKIRQNDRYFSDREPTSEPAFLKSPLSKREIDNYKLLHELGLGVWLVTVQPE